MKTTLSILLAALAAVTMTSARANASVVKRPCSFQDHQALLLGLSKGRLEKGLEKRDALVGLLSEEMGPVCRQVLTNEPQIEIAGYQKLQYEIIGSGERYFKVTLVSTLARPLPQVWIE